LCRWHKAKKEYLETLEREIEIGKVDRDIIPLLRKINSLDEYYTTSSCSGRIQITAAKLPGDKFNLITLAKWHRVVDVKEVLRVIEASSEEDIWFGVQPPILHVVCKDLTSAERLLELARNNGFKHSGIQGLNPERVVLEITSTERIETPLRLNGIDFFDKGRLELLVKVGNELLVKGKMRLARLEIRVSSLNLSKISYVRRNGSNTGST